MTWKPLKTADDIRDLITSYQPVQVVTTAFQMGVFVALDSDGPQTADQLSNTCEAHPRSFALLLNACVGLGLLSFDLSTQCYDLSQLARDTLLPQNPAYLGNFMRLQGDIGARWQKLSEGVTYNQRVNSEKRQREDGSQREWNRQFIMGLHDSTRAPAASMAEVLAPVLEKRDVKSLLDVGCGSGSYSMALAARLAKLDVTLFDLPGVLSVTGELVQRPENVGVGSRVHLAAGDFHDGPLAAANSFDAALLFGVLFSETLPGQAALLQKIADVLRPGGMLVIRGPILNKTKTAPLEATFAALQTLLSTDDGNVLSLDELRELLKKNGFAQVTTIIALGQRLVLATKPPK